MQEDTPTTTGKGAQCAGCGHYFPVRHLTEVEEGSLEFLGRQPLCYLPGDLLCPQCYRRAA